MKENANAVMEALIGGLSLIAGYAALAGGLTWAFLDAKARGCCGFKVVALLLIAFPIGSLLWLPPAAGASRTNQGANEDDSAK